MLNEGSGTLLRVVSLQILFDPKTQLVIIKLTMDHIIKNFKLSNIIVCLRKERKKSNPKPDDF